MTTSRLTPAPVTTAIEVVVAPVRVHTVDPDGSRSCPPVEPVEGVDDRAGGPLPSRSAPRRPRGRGTRGRPHWRPPSSSSSRSCRASTAPTGADGTAASSPPGLVRRARPSLHPRVRRASARGGTPTSAWRCISSASWGRRRAGSTPGWSTATNIPRALRCGSTTRSWTRVHRARRARDRPTAQRSQLSNGRTSSR